MAAEPQPIPTSWRLEPLAGWHLPLLSDPAFVPLQPVLQRAVLLGLPERLIHALTARQAIAPVVLVAFSHQVPLALIITRRLNRSGSCWQVQHLRLAGPAGQQDLGTTLLREAIHRAKDAASWIASASSLDSQRLAMLREQGFQPLRTDQLWCWQASGATAPGSTTSPAAPSSLGELQLRTLNPRSGALLWLLEQAANPAHLRQLLDRRVEDLLDQSHGKGWMWVDPSRNQAVAAVRWIGEHAGGGHDVELTVHPGWEHLIGDGCEQLLQIASQRLGDGEPLWLRSDVRDQSRQHWLGQQGAQQHGERVLMARSVWRRQEHPAQAKVGKGLEAVLGQLQPQRRPMPTPVAPR
ncbi:hypothetical protein [Cyanobium sp. HWJ4-Hawea]|uniref:hypothetical protein n=1 Tax=Cyanobium sp. HWJ4-Hawea TaxID=2823713 RepID=UPI0020CBD236|nr:hypothetical protein [Cyanobium sp. HWJ4-Hawea]